MEVVGHLDNLFLFIQIMQLFPPIPVFSPPAQTEATNNIKNIRNDRAHILMNNIDLFVVYLFLMDRGPVKALPQTKRKTKVSFSNSRNWKFPGMSMCFHQPADLF